MNGTTRKRDGTMLYVFFLDRDLAGELKDWVPDLMGDFIESLNNTLLIGFKMKHQRDSVYEMCLRRIASQHLTSFGHDPKIWRE